MVGSMCIENLVKNVIFSKWFKKKPTDLLEIPLAGWSVRIFSARCVPDTATALRGGGCGGRADSGQPWKWRQSWLM